MRQLKLGMHTYTLHLWGFGQIWFSPGGETYDKDYDLIELIDKSVSWGLDGLHITGSDLESRDDKRLEQVAKAAADKGLYLEYNFSLNEESDPRINDTFEKAPYVAHKLGADLAKCSLDIRRKPPLYGSCMQAHVMKQLADIHDQVKKALPAYEKYKVRLAIENHTETYADEILWLVNQINHPLVGVCLDTVNSFPVLEGPEAAVEKLAPQAICVHFCDHKLDRDEYGARFHGVAIGDGDIDCAKVLDLLRRVSPLDRITFEIEWDKGSDTLEEAKNKQLEACLRSIKYCREVLKIGREQELIL
ncbi:MAG: sugar phosphate isomerase/epimerase [Deltaproteobacteria bacterium]|jgi:sugar phosphate isomerase/epimerase|nr:sugar phosphate isomerase/epimerase [Deltaproteobacteria bacterium]